jgi:hypothetical protein
MEANLSRPEGAHRIILSAPCGAEKFYLLTLFQTLHVWLPSLCAFGATNGIFK